MRRRTSVSRAAVASSWRRVEQAWRKWAAARVWTARRAPYLASAVLALEPVVVEQLDGASYDLRAFPVDPAWHIYLDPDALEAADVPEIGFWLLHQTAHLLRRHADRWTGHS